MKSFRAIPSQVLENLGWSGITTALAARAASERGRQRCLALPLLATRAEVEASLGRIAEARELLRMELDLPVASAADVRALLRRAAKGALLDADELRACAATIRAASRVRAFFGEQRERAPLLAALASTLPEASSLAARIESSFEPSGRLKDTASASLESLRSNTRRLHQAIQERLEGLLGSPEFAPALRESYVSIRNERYVVPVQASFRSQVPGIVHNASNSGQTLFVEPEAIVGLGNDLSIAESMVQEEERRILAELSLDLGEREEELGEAVERLAELDGAWAAARLAEDLDASPPAIAPPGAPFVLRDARHPLLLLQGQRAIGNHILLEGEQRALVVSGPNAGGKTVALSTVGLCALMLRAGLPIPAAPGSSLPLYRGIDCALGDDQDLERGLSTFSAHLLALKGILERAGRDDLILIDEITADTDPKEGAALAAGVLHELVDRGAQVVVTTHLEELKALGLVDPRFANASVKLDPQSLAPTFRLELGTPGVSSALAIAARVGLPPSVLEAARRNLEGGSALGEALARLAEERRATEAERLALGKERAAIAEEREALAASRRDLERARAELEATVRAELAEELRAARQEVAGWVAQLTEAPSVRRAVETQRRIEARLAAEEQEAKRAAAKARLREEAPAGPLAVGSRVRLLGLGAEGRILELHEDQAVVQAGILKTRVPLRELVALPGKAPAAPKPRREAREMAPGAVLGPEARCDLRGMRADDALREMEAFLDRLYSEGAQQALIVHGLGTGALMKAVREALGASPYVGAFRPGDRHEGGAGVTVVELRA